MCGYSQYIDDTSFGLYDLCGIGKKESPVFSHFPFSAVLPECQCENEYALAVGTGELRLVLCVDIVVFAALSSCGGQAGSAGGTVALVMDGTPWAYDRMEQ